jgi:hypothetical protein
MKNFLRNKSVGFYLGLGAGIVGLAALITYLIYGVRNTFNYLVLSLLIVYLVIDVLYCLRGYEFLPLLAAIVAATVLAAFFYEIYGTFIDYFNQVNFWGDVTQLGIIMTFMIMVFIGLLVWIVECFLGRYSTKIQKKGAFTPENKKISEEN